MNRVELIELIASENSLSKVEAGRVLNTILDAVMLAVKKGEGVTLPGFGSFKQASRGARTGRNPATGAKIKIAAVKLPKFSPGAAFKAAVDPKAAARKAAKNEAAAGKAPAKKAAAKKSAVKAAPASKKAAAKKVPAKKAAAKKTRKA